ncbi:PilZ domain-containing protein [Denitrobaculum tricleocarpae]|uniref:PilZ domain-containing protein n=1 Tax=Denitrobaculum tricleocarpae TaxID=2591009 RepID=A0A545TPW5_9PROT|nr:PilZ domain-containing protein [Denitrobaculum tricleocarpae]TQV79259.1 PilZ domain-containing protein [Denitrobaculum tricleocarpae]
MAQVNSAADMRFSNAASKDLASEKPGPRGSSAHDSSAHDSSAEDSSIDDRRSWQRFMLESPASITLQVSGHDNFEDVELVDVSLGGFRLHFDHDLPPGSEVAIDHPTAGTMRGKLAWQTGGDIGIHMMEDDNRRTYLLRLISMILHNEVRVTSL